MGDNREKAKLIKRASRDLILAALRRSARASRNRVKYTRKKKHPKKGDD